MIGHETARTVLERQLPPATLLYGPPSVGKRTLALHLADHHRVHVLDRWLVLDNSLTISTVRLVASFASRAPQGAFKLVIARLEDAGRPALNAMLKTLEEPPPRVKFMLLSSGKPLSTVASRCTVFELGALSGNQLEHVYRNQGMPATKARRAAVYARGNVLRGFDAERADAHRSQVVTMVKALALGDRDQFATAFKGWDGRCSELLHVLLTEALTGRWSAFREDDAAGLHNDRRRLWHMTIAVVRVKDVRPRLGVRAALEPFLSRR